APDTGWIHHDERLARKRRRPIRFAPRLLSLFLGTICWAIHLAFRLTVALSVAQNSRSAVPEWYPAMRMWAGAMYALYMPLAYLAVAAFGAAMLNVGWISKGWGRTFIIFGLI